MAVGLFIIITTNKEIHMGYDEAFALLKEHGQTQLLDYYDELDDKGKERLLKDIAKIDFTVLSNIDRRRERKLVNLSPINTLSISEIETDREKYEESGLKALKDGEVAAVLLAGGMGSRLGYNEPKGTYDIGETRHISLFELQMRTVKDVAKRCGREFTLFIMTSEQNNEMTEKFFKEHDYFGYGKQNIFFYTQDETPACGPDGKILLDEKDSVCFSPNGNGGWYTSLISSGLYAVIKDRNIKWLNVYSVDNPLQKICDPVFIGATILSKCMCGAKVVKKICPSENVGVIVLEDGKPSVIEYYEMSEELANMKDEDGELMYRYGVILNYLYNVKRLDKIAEKPLPYHVAKKSVPHIENGQKITPIEANCYKFETLVVDMVKLMDTCLGFEVDREKEFAPVKNLTGCDSVDTTRELLKENGYKL